MERVDSIAPNVTTLADVITDQQDEFKDKMQNLEKLKGEVEKAVTTAKDTANRINVGVQFDISTAIQLPPPENIEDMGISTHVSAYFKTSQKSGFLMYLGNPKGSKLGGNPNVSLFSMRFYNFYFE